MGRYVLDASEATIVTLQINGSGGADAMIPAISEGSCGPASAASRIVVSAYR